MCNQAEDGGPPGRKHRALQETAFGPAIVGALMGAVEKGVGGKPPAPVAMRSPDGEGETALLIDARNEEGCSAFKTQPHR